MYITEGQYENATVMCNRLLDSLNNIDNQAALADTRADIHKCKAVIAYKNNDLSNAVAAMNTAISLDSCMYGKESKKFIEDEEQMSHYLSMSGNFTSVFNMANHVTSYKESYINNRFADLTANERTLLWEKHNAWFDQQIPFFADRYFNYKPLSQLAYDAILYSKGILLNTEQTIGNIVEMMVMKLLRTLLNS